MQLTSSTWWVFQYLQNHSRKWLRILLISMTLEEELKGPYFVLWLNYCYFILLDSFVSFFFFLIKFFFLKLRESLGNEKLFCKEEAQDTGWGGGGLSPGKLYLVLEVSSWIPESLLGAELSWRKPLGSQWHFHLLRKHLWAIKMPRFIPLEWPLPSTSLYIHPYKKTGKLESKMKTVSTFQWWVHQFSLIHSNKGFLSPHAPVLSEVQQFSDKHGAVSL